MGKNYSDVVEKCNMGYGSLSLNVHMKCEIFDDKLECVEVTVYFHVIYVLLQCILVWKPCWENFFSDN